MKISLSPSWELTDENSASTYGLPVLANTETREAYGPDEIINVDGKDLRAVRLVDRFLSDIKDLSAEQVAFIRKFFLT